MGPVTFIALLATLLMGAANVESQRRVIGREPPSTDGWRPVPGSTEAPRYSTQAVGHPVLDRLRAHLEDAERRKVATTPTPSVLASFSAVGPRRDQNAGFSGRLVPPPRDQPPPATFPQDSRSHGHAHDLSPASQTHPGPYYLHSLLPPPRASDFLLEGPGATSYVSFPPFSNDAYFGGAKQQATAPQLQFFPQQPQAQPQAQAQAQAQQDAFSSLPQRQAYYQQPQPQEYQQQLTQQYQQQQPQQATDYLLSTQHRQHPSAVSSQYTSHQASSGLGAGQSTSVFGGRDPVSATSRPQTSAAATAATSGAAAAAAAAGAGSVTFHGNIRDQAAYLSASSLAGQGHRFETKRPSATASLGNYSPGPAPTTVTQYPQPAVALFQQQAYTPSYAELPVHTSAGVVGYTLGVAGDEGTTAGSQLETPAQRGQSFLQLQHQQQQQTFREQPNSLQRPDGPTASEKPGRKRRPPTAQKKPAATEASGEAQVARRPPQPPPRQYDPYFLQQQYQPEAQHNTQQQQQQQQSTSWPPTAPQRHVPSAPEASQQQVATQQETTPGQRHGGRRRPPQPEASTHTPSQHQQEAGQLTTPRQHARRPPQRQQFAPSAQGPTSTPQLEQPTAGGEYRPHRRRRPTQTQQEQPAVTAPGAQYAAPQQETAIRHQQAYYQSTANLQASENAATAPGAAAEVPSAPSAPASADAHPSHEHVRRRPQNKQKYHVTMDNDKRTGDSNDWEQTQNTVKPARLHTRRPVEKQNTQTNFATEDSTGNGNTYSQPQPTGPEGRPQQRRRPVRPHHRNPPATTPNTYPVTENYPETQRDEETHTNVPVRPEETPTENAPPIPDHVQNQEVQQQVYTRRPSTRYSTTESVTQAAAEPQDEEQPSQRTRVRQHHVSRRPAQGTQQKELTTVVHYRRPVHPSRRPQYKKGARPTRPPPEYETDSTGQQEATNDPVSQSDSSGDYVQDFRLAESKKVQRQRYRRPQTAQNFAEDAPARTAAVANTVYQLQSSSPLDAEDNYAVDQQTAPAPVYSVRQRINQQGLVRGKTKYNREPLPETDTPLPEPTQQVYVESPLQTEPDFENDVLGGGTDARFPSVVDYGPDEEESDSESPAATTTTSTTTTSTTTTTTTTPTPSTTRPVSTVSSALEKLRQRSRYNATRPRFSVRDFQERLNRLSTSTAAPESEAAESTEAPAPASRYSGRQRSTTAAPTDQDASRPRPAARDPARVNSARYRASTPATTTSATPSTRYKYKSRYRSTFSTSTTTEEPTVATTAATLTPTPSALYSRPSLRTKGIFSAVRPNPLLRMATSLGTTTTTTTTTTTPAAPTTSAASVAAFSDDADEPTAPSAPSAPGVFGVRTAEPPSSSDDDLSQSRRIAELTLAAGARAPSSAAAASTTATSQPQHTTDLLSAYWAQQDSSASPALSTDPSPYYSSVAAEGEQSISVTTPDASSYPSTAADSVADQSSTSQHWTEDAVPPTQMIADLTSSASASDFFHKSMTSKHSLRITMATDDPILPLEAFFPSWGGKDDSSRR